MKKYPIYFALTALFVLIVVVYSWTLGRELYRYYELAATTRVTQVEWSVKEIGSDRFAPHARFSYFVDSKVFKNEQTLEVGRYRNAYAIEQDLPFIEKKFQTVWYSAYNPAISALQRDFPLKLICLPIFVIGFLGWYRYKALQAR